MNFSGTASLPKIEVAGYCIIWIGGVFYSAYHVYAVSESKFPHFMCVMLVLLLSVANFVELKFLAGRWVWTN